MHKKHIKIVLKRIGERGGISTIVQVDKDGVFLVVVSSPVFLHKVVVHSLVLDGLKQKEGCDNFELACHAKVSKLP